MWAVRPSACHSLPPTVPIGFSSGWHGQFVTEAGPLAILKERHCPPLLVPHLLSTLSSASYNNRAGRKPLHPTSQRSTSGGPPPAFRPPTPQAPHRSLLDDPFRNLASLPQLAGRGNRRHRCLVISKPYRCRRAAHVGGAPDKAKPVSFHADILPILQAKCQGCHQPAKAGGNLDMTMFKSLLSAGESGTLAVVPGKPDDSYLLDQITPDNGEAAMPKDKPPLAATEIELIRRWIEEGAKDDTPRRYHAADRRRPPAHLQWPAGDHVARLVAQRRTPRRRRLPRSAAAQSRRQRPTTIERSPAWSAWPSASIRSASRRMARSSPSPAAAQAAPAKCRSGMSPITSCSSRCPSPATIVFGVSWSPDGKRVAFGCTDKSVRAIDTETGEQVLFQQVHDDWVLGTTFSSTARTSSPSAATWRPS